MGTCCRAYCPLGRLYASPLKHFWLFIVSELIEFACAGLRYIMKVGRKSNGDRKLLI
ncbi:MAG: hypothetical protein K0S67_211 [Nitrososphaeraceae archaeon]|nr:hypothetical protein [Nitrososphaeraceae archaeon]